ncbi:MAG: AAA family ATPase [Paludibacteraceae bacterium]|nr:AAA family ATPase [Paludibacteraceae bacterium]
MIIQRIKAEYYKTYKSLDLDLSVEADRPIILIGGQSGGGKTTLFEAIYGALYGLEITTEKEFKELFNVGVQDYVDKSIVLEIYFSGEVLNTTKQYCICRTYKVINGRVVENVKLCFDSNTYTYGSATPEKVKAENQKVVNKIIDANLPKELSNYFLFDAMNASKLVKENQINNLIQKNINSVMRFNRYQKMEKAASSLLEEEKAKRLENEQQEKEYKQLVADIDNLTIELDTHQSRYEKALLYSADNRQLYESLKQGENDEAINKGKIAQIQRKVDNLIDSERSYRDSVDALVKNLETDVVMVKLADTLKSEVELILSSKSQTEVSRKTIYDEVQLKDISQKIIAILTRRHLLNQEITVDSLVKDLQYEQEDNDVVHDRYSFLSDSDLTALRALSQTAVNCFLNLNEKKDGLEIELEDLPNWEREIQLLQGQLNGTDYTLIAEYEKNEREIAELKNKIVDTKNRIETLQRRKSSFDFQVSNRPDPKYDLLCKLPQFFKDLNNKLLRHRKQNIERRMKECLNKNLVVYRDMIGRVELSQNDNNISFKMFHVRGNEISLNQLNAASKQMVMQVLLKVLYELGDYEPPVMIDTVMGVLDKASRETIIQNYFPDLAKQTILLSTDTEITVERDFEKVASFISKTYTLHRDLEEQCTTITDDYFGERKEDYCDD